MLHKKTSVNSTPAHIILTLSQPAHSIPNAKELLVPQSIRSRQLIISNVKKCFRLASENKFKKSSQISKYVKTKLVDHNFKVGDGIVLSAKLLTLKSCSFIRIYPL